MQKFTTDADGNTAVRGVFSGNMNHIDRITFSDNSTQTTAAVSTSASGNGNATHQPIQLGSGTSFTSDTANCYYNPTTQRLHLVGSAQIGTLYIDSSCTLPGMNINYVSGMYGVAAGTNPFQFLGFATASTPVIFSDFQGAGGIYGANVANTSPNISGFNTGQFWLNYPGGDTGDFSGFYLGGGNVSNIATMPTIKLISLVKNANATTTELAPNFYIGADNAAPASTVANNAGDLILGGSVDVKGKLQAANFSATTGATIDEFSTDGALTGNSNTAVPTEQAVKTYADTKMASPAWAAWTPTITVAGGTAPVYTTTTARYATVGKNVEYYLYLTGDGGAEGAGASALTITIPANVTINGNGSQYVIGYGELINGGTITPVVMCPDGSGGNTAILRTTVVWAAISGDSQNNSTRLISLKGSFEKD